MTMIEIKTPERTDARKKFLHCVFTTALEGGIGYWSVCDEYHWSKPGLINGGSGGDLVDDLDGFYATIESNDEDGWGITKKEPVTILGTTFDSWEYDNQLRIDIDVIERGSNMLVEKVLSGEFTNDYLLQFVQAWISDGDNGDYDCSGADLVVQLGLFGEVVYA